MAEIQINSAARAHQQRPSAFLALFRRSETARGYLLLSPALLVMTIGMLIPFTILIAMSFWTRDGFDFDTTFSLNNYATAMNVPIYNAFLARSFWISGITTVATVLLCYPMAYYVAFHVHRNKMLWII